MFWKCDLVRLERYGERGWIWEIDTEIGVRRYRTSGMGEGRFHLSTRGDAVQEAGFAQWKLPQDKSLAAMKIVNCFSERQARHRHNLEEDAVVRRMDDD